ncbi:ABC transporter ATP-binding protein [Brachybacterium sp. MASK1Z-5]|uniref:ABC transporter ATP-binding protein n=2 Tax=Brachybacterium halotolerans TaxID=2795215 RepID=A0ABS1BAB6_9MICO|nr:ABC transporter ATP-binding protein [Brachybacterium halotolerans]MBK0331609.1 ABC transporter ATP-binding protein [Brachybacterium halotolerans]
MHLRGSALTVAYGPQPAVLHEVSVDIRPGSFTAIIGPNACGKSTLLRSLARVLSPSGGHVLLDGTDIARMRSRELATAMGLLPQQPGVPEGIVVADLVARGRHPHQSVFSRWSREDERAIAVSMERTGILDIAHRSVDTLSGGQRQRVWIAMALAQDTELLLLDEPTTFLDITHQIEVLRLLRELQEAGRTIVAVLHELNQAARFATDVIAMRDGRIIADGAPAELFTPEKMRAVYDLDCRVISDPGTGSPVVLPR